MGISYTVGIHDTYYVILTDANGCTITSNSITYEPDPPAGVVDASDVGISIYPNPFREETTLDFGRVVDNAELRLFDVLGKLVGEYDINEASHFVLNREEKGVYFIDVKIENQKGKIFKLIAE